jgi:hypothetical protein
MAILHTLSCGTEKGLLSKLIDKESPFRCSNELAANKLATIKTTKRLFQGQLIRDVLIHIIIERINGI